MFFPPLKLDILSHSTVLLIAQFLCCYLQRFREIDVLIANWWYSWKWDGPVSTGEGKCVPSRVRKGPSSATSLNYNKVPESPLQRSQESSIRSASPWQCLLGLLPWRKKDPPIPHTLSPSHPHVHMQAHTHSVMHICKCSQMHTHTRIVTHTCTHVQTLSHTLIPTSAHTRWALCRPFPKNYCGAQPSPTTSALMVPWPCANI